MKKYSYEDSEQKIKALKKKLKEYDSQIADFSESEISFRYLTEKSKDIIYLMSLPDGKYEYMSPAAKNIFGYSPEEIYKKPFFIKEILHPDWLDYFDKEWARLLKGEMPPSYEYQIIHKSGETRWIFQRNTLIKNKDGIPNAIEGVITDISDRKNADENLRKSELKYRNLVENIQDGYVRVDLDGKILEYNRAYREMLGYTDKELAGKSYSDITPEKWHSIEQKIISEQLRTKAFTKIYEKEYIHMNGTVFPIELQTYSIFDNKGNAYGMWAFVRDISERKKVENDLLRAHDELEKRVLERTSEIEEINKTLKIEIEERIRAELELKEHSDHLEEKVTGRTADLVKSNEELQNEISERKKIEEDLRESEEKIRELTNSIPLAIFETDINGRLSYGNDHTFKLFEYSKANFLKSLNVIDMIHPDDRKRAVINMQKRMKGELVDSYEYTAVKRDGTLFPVIIYSSLILEKGKTIGLRGFLVDITDRKKAEKINSILYEISKAVNDSPDLDTLYSQIHISLRKIIDTKNFFIALFDKEKDIVRFPYYLDEKDGSYDIIDDTDSGSLTAEVILKEKSLFFSEQALKGRYAAKGKEPHGTRPRVWLGSPLRIKNEVIGAIAVQSYTDPHLYSEEDINLLEPIAEHIAIAIQKKQIEEQNKRLEEQLYQAQKMESIGRLAGGIAHDFNNILTGIMGCAELLSIHFEDENSSEGIAANIILKGTERAAHLTQQLLGFARGGKYNPVPLNTNNLIRSTVKVSEKIFEKNITIKFELEKDLFPIEADKNQMNQVLTNLIINAKEAMPNGGELLIETENIFLDESYTMRYPEFRTGQYVKISVMDTGLGMIKEVKDHIFEPFFTTKGEGKGTGLGLATVFGIVKNHNGYINVYSESGEGTVFNLYLPVTDKKIITEKRDKEIFRGEATILLVDDEEHVRGIAESLLSELGYKVLIASDGNEAIKIFKEKSKKIDLVILDMIMPKMAGRETFLELKKINPDVKVLLSSGFSQNGMANEILNEGAIDFIQKPFRLQELSKIIAKTLK